MFHNDYPVNWGEPVISCSTASMTYNYKTKEIKWHRQSDIPILPGKPLITVEGRGIHNNTLSEDTFTVLRGGRINGNEIRKNSRQIGS